MTRKRIRADTDAAAGKAASKADVSTNASVTVRADAAWEALLAFVVYKGRLVGEAAQRSADRAHQQLKVSEQSCDERKNLMRLAEAVRLVRFVGAANDLALCA